MNELNTQSDKIIKYMDDFIDCSKIRLAKLSEQKDILNSIEKEMNIFRKIKKEKRKTKIHDKQSVSDELAVFLKLSDKTKISKSDVMKYICKYIKDNNLRDSEKKRYFYTDTELSKLFKITLKSKLITVEIMKYIHPHFKDE